MHNDFAWFDQLSHQYEWGGHPRLHLGRTAQRIHHTAELDEQPIARGLNQPAIVRADRRIKQLGTIAFSAWRVPPSSAPISRE
jgi:hypothetical protein